MTGHFRAYLESLLRERKAAHLILVTRMGNDAPVQRARTTSAGSGVLEGLDSTLPAAS